MATKIKGVCCDSCKMVLYIQAGSNSNTPPTPFPDLKFCPVCGKEADETVQTLDDAWWKQMQFAYGLPVDIMKQLYRAFLDNLNDRIPIKSFDKFYKKTMQELIQTSNDKE